MSSPDRSAQALSQEIIAKGWHLGYPKRVICKPCDYRGIKSDMRVFVAGTDLGRSCCRRKWNAKQPRIAQFSAGVGGHSFLEPLPYGRKRGCHSVQQRIIGCQVSPLKTLLCLILSAICKGQQVMSSPFKMPRAQNYLPTFLSYKISFTREKWRHPVFKKEDKGYFPDRNLRCLLMQQCWWAAASLWRKLLAQGRDDPSRAEPCWRERGNFHQACR